MSTPSSSSSPSSPSSPPSNLPTTHLGKKSLLWTHQETISLVQSYQDKWYSLKRGMLKAYQWEEVAVTAAARCGYDYNHPYKSAIQCRHKMEKLRRRYREEKQRFSGGGRCSWPYFTLMDTLECGSIPPSARPLDPASSQKVNGSTNNYAVDDDDDDEEEDEEDYGYRSKSRSINYLIRKPAKVNRFSRSVLGPEVPMEAVTKRKRKETEAELAEEMKAFGERMISMERKRMEMMKETERWRMEMEKERMQMIMDSQRKILGMIATAFGSSQEEGSF